MNEYTKVGQLNNQISDIQETINKVKSGTHPNVATWNEQTSDQYESMPQPQQNMLLEEMTREQDVVLDSVYSTVNTLKSRQMSC